MERSYGFYFVTYEAICRAWIKDTRELSVENFVKLNLAGGVAGLSAWIPVYPFDTVKTRMQARRIHSHTAPTPRRRSR